MPTHLFVYGTLMRGESRHHHLAGSEFVAAAYTVPDYVMFDCGDFPAVVEAYDGLVITGELWRVSQDTLRVLDGVEGIDEGLYARHKVLLLPPFDDLPAETYVYMQGTAGLPMINGNWRARTRRE